MGAGRVSTVQQLLHNPGPKRRAIEDTGARDGGAVAAAVAHTGAERHWHLSDLLHPFHRK